MDKFELLGILLQDLRDNHGPDEEDLGPHILRETTRIYGLMIENGHLSRTMFDLTGIKDPRDRYSVSKKYSLYQTTNFPINFVVFADAFSRWLLGKDKRARLYYLDLIKMIQEVSWLEVVCQDQIGGTLITVRSQGDNDINEQVFVRTK